MILLFLASGLFLGWSLGANDASNVFGSAVGSKMVSFRTAALIASVAVILGAVIQGAGAADTLGKLGSVNALGGAFTLALAAAVTVFVMTKFALPVSTTQAIVGAIIGWNFFTGNQTDTGTLSKIVITWITGPVLGAVFAVLLFILIIKIKKISRIHLFRFESIIRAGLIITGAFGAYSLGANNIANVMGVFIPSFSLDTIDLRYFTLNSSQQLFLLGGLAIAVGIITYSRKVMDTIGENIVELSPDGAMVVVLSQSLVLFIFSSSGLSSLFVRAGLPPIPMVPVSSSQVIVGCVIGIGLYKGARNINFRILGEIAIGWVSTPLISGLLAFFSLFFMKNLFGINVGQKGSPADPVSIASTVQSGAAVSQIFLHLLASIILAGIVATALYFLFEWRKEREFRKSEKRFWENMK